MKHLLTIFVLLCVLSACNVGRNGEMEALLDRADSMNRAYIPMTDGIDSLLLEATQQTHGSLLTVQRKLLGNKKRFRPTARIY